MAQTLASSYKDTSVCACNREHNDVRVHVEVRDVYASEYVCMYV